MTSARRLPVMTESSESSFGDAMRRRLIEDFVVAYYNGPLKPNLAEKNPANGRDAEYLMDGGQFEKIRKAEVWSYANAVGSGYQYRVVYKDRRFSDLERLVAIYVGSVQVEDEERENARQSLYQLILLMVKEGRLPKTFKIQSSQEVQETRLLETVEELGRAMEELGRKVSAIEERLAASATEVKPSALLSSGVPIPQHIPEL